MIEPNEPEASGQAEGSSEDKPRKKRRRRRPRKPGEANAAAGTSSDASPAPEASQRAPREDRHDREGRGPRRKKRSGRPHENEPDPTQSLRERKRETDRAWDPTIFDIGQTFESIGLREEVVRACTAAGFKHPTKIQATLVPVALTGRDVLGQAKTGTGKTAAFALPLLHQIEAGTPFQAIILAPTRELAIQIQQDFAELGRFTDLTCVAIYGGQSINAQAEKLKKGPEIIVGTPGRILDMIDRRYLSLAHVRHAVLDEVDRMFDIGFRDDIRAILAKCPKERQTVFVSATLSAEIEDLARRHMTNPEKLVVSAGSLTVELVKQHYLTVAPWDKKRLLAHLLTHEAPDLTLVFCRMKRTVDDVVKYLAHKGIEAHAIHGDMPQGKRNATMEKLRHGSLAVLVASDLASRGIDVEGITHVVNYDLPEDPDLYVHRIGRTARAGRDGVAWSLVTPAQGGLLTQIELLINAEIPKLDYPDFEPRERPSDWRDTAPSGQPVVEVVAPPKEEKNRYATPLPPAAATKDGEDQQAKFPDGVVPTKLPPRLMRGRVKPRGR
ncbi:MAG: DEAD/DEAH box helicase [Phycisphaeraceae bacterium]|nr:DEAD/DEAH box helicase [Phycisphaeraceae bacterium]MCW5761778.1 DEAD/DEAH box helicase [Phycisphaeraceae bacterium]